MKAALVLLLLPIFSLPAVATGEAPVPATDAVRPAIIAMFEPPDVMHAEFDLDPDLQAEMAERAGLPQAPVVDREEFATAVLSTNTFYRFNEGRIAGYFRASPGGFTETTPNPLPHGTAVASRIAGQTTGACDSCLIISMSGSIPHALAWAYHQPWIDAITLSTDGPHTFVSDGTPEAVAALIRTGRPVFLANGNVAVAGGTQPVSALANSGAIGVGMSMEDGAYSLNQRIGADLVTSGSQVRVALQGGGITTSTGTSLASPWAAGKYGALLIEGWRNGWFQRTVAADTVYQSIAEVDGMPSYLADGRLDGDDVLLWLGSVATYDYPFYGDPLGLKYGDPSAWVGYGILVEREWTALAAWPPSSEDPSSGPGHETQREHRLRVALAMRAANAVSCRVGQLVIDLKCADWHLQNDEWFR